MEVVLSGLTLGLPLFTRISESHRDAVVEHSRSSGFLARRTRVKEVGSLVGQTRVSGTIYGQRIAIARSGKYKERNTDISKEN